MEEKHSSSSKTVSNDKTSSPYLNYNKNWHLHEENLTKTSHRTHQGYEWSATASTKSRTELSTRLLKSTPSYPDSPKTQNIPTMPTHDSSPIYKTTTCLILSRNYNNLKPCCQETRQKTRCRCCKLPTQWTDLINRNFAPTANELAT